MLESSETVIRMIFSALVGFLLGHTRKHKPAGMRTFALIAIGATLFTIISIDDLGGDKTRIIGQVVSGMGFLGLGVIWKTHGKLKGLTTAAAMWVTTAIGVLVGIGMWLEAFAASMISIMILYSKQPLVKSGLEDGDE